MSRKEYRDLVSVDEARSLFEKLNIDPTIESTSLENALGETLAEDIVSDVDVPSFNRSIMDGYAVRAEDTYQAGETNPVVLKLAGSVAAGCAQEFSMGRDEAIEISTGAPIPGGADAVVMVEYTFLEDGNVYIQRPVHTGENVMGAGSDIMKGERVLREGTLLGSREVGVLSAIGRQAIATRCVRVGIISTGDELVSPGSPLGPGLIYDSNSYALNASVLECGASPVMYGIVRDDEKAMEDIVNIAVAECDVVLTSGSTSAGAGDVMYKVIQDMGEIFAHGIKIKPGKPVVIGMIREIPVIGLPGNPTSALMIFNEFVAPLVRSAVGFSEKLKLTTRGLLGTSIRSQGRHQLFPVGLVRDKVYPADKGSGAITTLADADGFIEIGSEMEFMEQGTPLEVTLFGDVKRPDLLFVGGYCPGIDLLEDMTGMKFRMLNKGSTGGFSAMSSGIADVSGVNYPDPSGVYNIPVVKRMGLSDVVLVKGYIREQGLIVRPESSISSLEDVLDKRIVNRNRGSGTRALLDLQFEELAKVKGLSRKELTGSVQGYDSGAKTHRAVCEAVKNEKADAGFGLRTVAEQTGLRFIPMAEEEFDLLIPGALIEIEQIKVLLECLASKEFAERLPAGMRVYDRTGELVLDVQG